MLYVRRRALGVNLASRVIMRDERTPERWHPVGEEAGEKLFSLFGW